jgi:hypothetical protein
MPDAILHIGFNKCGSTALQQWLGDQRGALADRGALYQRMDPRSDVICTNPHLQVLAFSLAGQPVPHRPMNAVLGITQGDIDSQNRVADAFRHSFEARVAQGGFDTWIGSSEALVARDMTPEAVGALTEWLSSLFERVRHVAYIRRPEPWMVSLYGHHRRKTKADETLSAFVDRVGSVPFARKLKIWEQAVGRDALDVRLFQEDWLKGAGLVEDFSTVPGLPTGSIDTRARRVNTSFKEGLRALSPLNRRPPRPRVPKELRDLIVRRNAEDMGWISNTFFADDQTDFRAWADTPSLALTET